MLEDANLADDDYDGRNVQRSWGTSITVGGTTYATSLFWQPLQNVTDPFQEVEDASEGVLEGADLFCIKGGKAPQFGICVSHEGYKGGEAVAAVSLATAMSNISSYVAVFKTPQGWWYTCIRNDIILSDGDMLFLSEEEAKNQFMSMLAVPDWGKKIAPAEWGLEETEEVSVEEILARGAKAKLQKIKGLRGAKLMIVIAVSVIVGIWLISSLINHLCLTPTVRPVVVPVKPKAVQQVQQPPEVKPWEKLDDPEMVLNSCYDKIIDLVKIMPPGWVIGGVTCNSGGVSTSWRRDLGRLAIARKAMEESGLSFSGLSFPSDGNSLTASLALPKINQINSPPAKNAVDLVNELNDTFQAIGHPISVGSATYTSPQGTVYRMVTFKLKTTYDPRTWIKMLTKYSGVTVKNLNYSPSTKVWDFEGTIYVL